MRKIFTLVSIVGVLAWQQVAMAANATVSVGPGGSTSFSPAQVTINVGDMVTWQWASGVHNITSTSGAWSPAPSDANNPTFSHTFTVAGTYPYLCTIHGSIMSGTVTVLSVSGTKEDAQQSKLLTIYPNPARDQFKLTFNGNSAKNYEVKVTNAIGKVVKTIPAEELKNAVSNNLVIDVTALPAGLYFYNLWNNDKMVETRRLIIQK